MALKGTVFYGFYCPAPQGSPMDKAKEKQGKHIQYFLLGSSGSRKFALFSPRESQHKPIPSPWDVPPTALCQLGNGKREQRGENSAGSTGKGGNYAGRQKVGHKPVAPLLQGQ